MKDYAISKRKTMFFLIITLCFYVLCACNNKKDIQTIDTTPYFTDESYIYILSGVDFIKKNSSQAYEDLQSGDFKTAAEIFRQKLKELDDTETSEYLWWSNALAIAYVIMDEIELAHETMDKLLAIAEEEGTDAITLVALYNNKGNIEKRMIPLDSEIEAQDSLDYYLKAYKYAHDYGADKYLEMVVNTNKALVGPASVLSIHDVKLDSMADEMSKLAAQEREFLGAYQMISVFNFKNLGSVYQMQEKYKKAENSYKKALEIYDDMNELNTNIELVKAGIHHDIARCYMDWGKPEKAEEEYDIAISLYESNRTFLKGNLRTVYINKGMNCRLLGVYEDGMDYLTKGLELCSPNSLDEGIACMNMASNFFVRGMYEECVPLELKAYKIMIDYNQPIQEDVKKSLKAIYHRVTDVPEQIETSFEEWLEKKMEELEDE